MSIFAVDVSWQFILFLLILLLTFAKFFENPLATFAH